MTLRGGLFTLAVVIGTAALGPVGGARASVDLDNLEWSVQYMIDQSQTVLGFNQFSAPRDNRGLAISPDGRYLYAGYNNGPEVRKIDLTESDYTAATVVRTTAVRGKAIAVDDQGRVYFAEGSSIKVYDADLSSEQLSITTTKCEGVAVTREGGTLVLYGTDRTDMTLTRWELTESAGLVTGATQAGLGGTGQVTITGAANLRGCEVDGSGRIWLADIDADKVFRINNDGTGLASATVTEAIDIGFDGGVALVTQYYTGTISVLDVETLGAAHSALAAPWGDLLLDGTSGGVSGIVVLPDVGFYVANEGGQTASERSTYGATDGESGFIGETFYTDMTHDDNDPLLYVTEVPEPGTMGLVALGALVLLRRRKR